MGLNDAPELSQDRVIVPPGLALLGGESDNRKRVSLWVRRIDRLMGVQEYREDQDRDQDSAARSGEENHHRDRNDPSGDQSPMPPVAPIESEHEPRISDPYKQIY